MDSGKRLATSLNPSQEEDQIGGCDMSCWRWFGGVLKEAGVEVTPANKEKIDNVIHEFVGKTSKYGHCSADWKKAGKFKTDEKERKKLVQALKKI